MSKVIYSVACELIKRRKKEHNNKTKGKKVYFLLRLQTHNLTLAVGRCILKFVTFITRSCIIFFYSHSSPLFPFPLPFFETICSRFSSLFSMQLSHRPHEWKKFSFFFFLLLLSFFLFIPSFPFFSS